MEKKNKRLFSKALFKQSCKANGTMWVIITLAVCFMLSCVMLVSSTSGVSGIKDGIENTIIEQTIESEINKSSINLYVTSDDAEQIFDKAFAQKIDELNSYDNYQEIKNITDTATQKGTVMVKNYVTEKVTNEVTAQLTAKVEARVTELVTAETTERLTNEVKAEVERMVTEEVTKRLTAEVTARVESQADQIAQEVQAAVMADMQTAEAMQKIQELMMSGMDQASATQQVINEYTAIETEKIKNQYIQKAQAEILTDAHKQEVAAQVLGEKQAEYTQSASAKILTDAHKQETANKVLSEKKNAFVAQAQSEIVTDANKTAVTNQVLNKYQSTWTEEGKKVYASEIEAITEKAEEDIKNYITDIYVKPAYEYAVDEVTKVYPEDKDDVSYGGAMVTINPDGQADDKYTENNEKAPREYIDDLTDYISDDILAWEKGNKTTTLADYVESDKRESFRNSRAYKAVSMLLASELTSDEYKDEIIDQLKEYSVTEEQYDDMGFDYKYCKTIAYEACLEYQNKLDYEFGNIDASIKSDSVAYNKEKQRIKDNLYQEVAGSLLDKLPDNVSDGIKDLGTMDMYGLIVGSIFFKMAGLLLPIIYIIMTSNSLIATQIDTGSMAYVLSTSTRREEVTFTQSLYLIGSTLLMFILTCVTSCVCYKLANVTTQLNYEKLIFINIGAFATMFAIAGINFLTSCIFDRSKRAMAIGGGVSIFFLVATMLGLFGSPVIPSVVRIEALNNFNYFSLITLFDVISILDCTKVWIWKALILVGVGLVGFVGGSIYFKKKDLPL